MSAGDWLAEIPPAASAIAAAAGVVFSGWKGIQWAARRERRRDAPRWDDAAGANERLFQNLSRQVDELRDEISEARQDCRACEQDKIQLRIEFNAEIRLMNAQYRERDTVLKAEIMVLRNVIRLAGLPIPAPPMAGGSALIEDDPPG